MHNKIQQLSLVAFEHISALLKRFFSKEGLTWLSAAYLFFLPLYIGEIVYDRPAYLFGQYFNYLHIRITVHLLLAIAIVVWKLVNLSRESRDTTLRAYSILLVGLALIWIYPINKLALSAEVAFFPIYFSSLFHFVELSTKVVAIVLVTKTVLENQQNSARSLFLWAISASLVIQSAFALGQYLTSGPVFPEFFSWIGQPLRFTSSSVIGMFKYPRIYGTTPHPNILAAILCYFSLISLTIPETKITRLFATITLSFSCALLLGTMSKIGLLTLVLMLFFLAYNKYCKPLPLSHILNTVGVILAVTLPIALPLLGYFWRVPLPYLYYRGEILVNYLRLITQLPWLLLTGTGYSLSAPTLLANDSLTLISPFIGNGVSVDVIHNIFLLSIVEFGVLPIVFVAILLARFNHSSPLVWLKNNQWSTILIAILLFLVGGFDHLLLY